MARGVVKLNEDLTEINGRIRVERGMDNHFYVYELVELKKNERIDEKGDEITSDTHRWVERGSFNTIEDANAFVAKM